MRRRLVSPVLLFPFFLSTDIEFGTGVSMRRNFSLEIGAATDTLLAALGATNSANNKQLISKSNDKEGKT